jgi:hypothetical protein
MEEIMTDKTRPPDIVARLTDLIEQATKERSHYYVKSVCVEAMQEIVALRGALTTASHALKAYQYGNSDPTLAKEVGTALDKIIAGRKP